MGGLLSEADGPARTAAPRAEPYAGRGAAVDTGAVPTIPQDRPVPHFGPQRALAPHYARPHARRRAPPPP
ncbi:hypothetical protein ACIRQY_09860 [Streptomyces sp. NPDC101490]|uniref:hypothetical protein n=1 Tax=Streptomyces sp. NPDC101490 TaxID=3366143 RepID=UPI0038075EF8